MFKSCPDGLKIFIRKLSLFLMVSCFLLALLLPQPYDGEKPGVFLDPKGKINVLALILFEILMITLSFTFFLIADATKVITYNMVKSTINNWKTEQRLVKIHGVLNPLPSFIKDAQHLEQEELRLKQKEFLNEINELWKTEKQNYDETVSELKQELETLKSQLPTSVVKVDSIEEIKTSGSKVKPKPKVKVGPLTDEEYDELFK